MVRAKISLIAAALAPLWSGAAHAENIEAAKRAYDAAAAAYDAKDYTRAANGFALADELAPNDRVLSIALKSAMLADDPVLAMTVAERAKRRNAVGEAGKLAERATQEYQGIVGTIRLDCVEQDPCTLRAGFQEISGGERAFLMPGRQAIAIRAGGRTTRRSVVLLAGKTITLSPAAQESIGTGQSNSEQRATGSTEADSNARGLPPAVFWTGVGVTTVLTGAAVWSSIDTKAKHDEFLDRPSTDAADSGKSAQTRTNILWISTAGVGALTAVVGGFLTEWRGGAGANVSVEGRDVLVTVRGTL